jgi:hypothetical protein
MSAMIHLIDEAETAPMPWAMPIPPEYAVFEPAQVDEPYPANTRSGRSFLGRLLATENVTPTVGCTLTISEGVVSSCWQPMFDGPVPSAHAFRLIQTAHQDAVTGVRAKAWAKDVYVDRYFAARCLGDYSSATGDAIGAVTFGAMLGVDPAPKGLSIVGRPDLLAGYERYAVGDWDGEQAQAISAETTAATRSLIGVLPMTFGNPDVAPAADGTIGLEWVLDSGPLRKLFIDVGPHTVWRAYWRLTNGRSGETQGRTSDPDFSGSIKALFRDLSM